MNLRGLVKSLLLVCALILVSCEGDKKESVDDSLQGIDIDDEVPF